METLLDIFCMIGINIFLFHMPPSSLSPSRLSHRHHDVLVTLRAVLIYCGMFANEIYDHVMFSLHNTRLPTIKVKLVQTADSTELKLIHLHFALCAHTQQL